MVVDYIDISRLLVFSQQKEESNIKKDKKRSRIDNDRTDGHDRSKNQQNFIGHSHSNSHRY